MVQPSMDRAVKQTLQNTQKHVNLRNNFKVWTNRLGVGGLGFSSTIDRWDWGWALKVANSIITEVTDEP